jgi:hypothetical protein
MYQIVNFKFQKGTDRKHQLCKETWFNGKPAVLLKKLFDAFSFLVEKIQKISRRFDSLCGDYIVMLHFVFKLQLCFIWTLIINPTLNLVSCL